MNVKMDLSTKLRLENSALGTYDAPIDSASFTIGKNITRDKFIGIVLTMESESAVMSYIVTCVQETKNVNGQALIVLRFANNIMFTYNPETGILSMNTPPSEG